MSAVRDHQRQQGVVLLLRSLTEKQLSAVLAEVGAVLKATDAPPKARTGKPCAVCGRIYPVCRAAVKSADDHEYEPTL